MVEMIPFVFAIPCKNREGTRNKILYLNKERNEWRSDGGGGLETTLPTSFGNSK
jgi:hypothetical protein